MLVRSFSFRVTDLRPTQCSTRSRSSRSRTNGPRAQATARPASSQLQLVRARAHASPTLVAQRAQAHASLPLAAQQAQAHASPALAAQRARARASPPLVVYPAQDPRLAPLMACSTWAGRGGPSARCPALLSTARLVAAAASTGTSHRCRQVTPESNPTPLPVPRVEAAAPLRRA